MNEEKQKKIRTQLINFMNKELIRNKKLKKSNFLINSMTLEQLEKKNMQCKDFYVKEKDKIYQNIDNGWIIGLNIYVNNLSNHNPFIYCLSNAIKDNYILNNIKNKTDIHINQINNINNNKETIIQKQSNKILFIQKEGNMGSPVDTSLLIKKELGVMKLKRKNHEFNSNKIPIHFSDRLLNIDNIEKEIEKDNDKKKENNIINNIDIINDIDENIKLTKQLSNETLETEISRIIKICHDDRYTNSFEHFPSDSKISELSKEIKIAKMYAKKLKYYCRTLKRKFPINNEGGGNKIENKSSELTINNHYNENIEKINEEKNNKKNSKENCITKDTNIAVKEKNKSKKVKKNSSRKIIKKNTQRVKEVNNKIDNIKQIIPKKKIKSEKNIKLKIKRDSFLKIIKDIENEKNNMATISTNINEFRTLDDKNKKKTNILKLSKKRKKSLEKENKSKPKIKIKKELIKSPLKIIKNKINKENKKHIKNHKTMKNMYILTDSPKLSISNLDKKKRIKEKLDEAIKNKIITETNRDKINSKRYHLHKNKNKKRGSVDTKMNMSGFEKLFFLKAKNKSTQEDILYNNKKKKKKSRKISNINTNINNSSLSQQKDLSSSIEKNKKCNKKYNKKNIPIPRNTKDEKKKTFAFLKIRKESTVLEAIKKMEKRKSTNFHNINAFGTKRKLSPVYNDDKKGNNTINENKKIENNSKKIKFKLSKLNHNENYNDNKRETDIFNLMDEFLYKRKHERRKKSNNVLFLD